MTTLGNLISGDLGYRIVLWLDPTSVLHLMLAQKRIYQSWWVPKFLEIVRQEVVSDGTQAVIDLPQWVTTLTFCWGYCTGQGDSDDDSDFDYDNEYNKIVPKIPHCPNVVKLHYHDTDIHCLEYFPKLKEFSAYHCFNEFNSQITLYNLVNINLVRVSSGLVPFFKNTPNLKILVCTMDADLDHWGTEECQIIGGLEKLEELIAGPLAVESFCFLQNKKNLRLLEMDLYGGRYNEHMKLPRDIQYFTELENLKSMALNCDEDVEEDVAVIEEIKTLVSGLPLSL